MTIVKKESIRSGKPVIKGTLVTVEDIAETFYSVGRSIDQISEDYNISKEEVEEALDQEHVKK
ncbi:MAG: DUF433 domain-containing protein [Candidatus Nanohaloarchaea archaeon]